ncbi:MAG: hypothetical protein RLZZ244_1108, partial [Verrucomicrobiota bacterium]
MKPPSSIALRKSTRILFFCALAALLWLAGYGYKRGFTRSWREAVFAEFRKHGIEVTFKKLTLDPFRGLVAREAVLYETSNRSRVLAEIDQAVLSVDLGRLARKRNFLTALELRDARLSLPIDPSNPSAPPLQIEHLRAHLFFPDQQVRVQQAEALVLGCRLSAQGWLTHPPTLQPAQPNAPR